MAKRSAHFLIGPNFTPVTLSATSRRAVDELIAAANPGFELSDEDKRRLWGALLASKRSLHKFAVINRYREQSADLKLLRTVKIRSGEVAGLLQKYASKKSLATPDSSEDRLPVYLKILREIQVVADRTGEREMTMAGLQPPEALQELYAGGLLAMIFENIFRRRATATIIPATEEPGPFIRFVQVAHRELGLAVPPAASVRTCRRRYQQKQKAKHTAVEANAAPQNKV